MKQEQYSEAGKEEGVGGNNVLSHLRSLFFPAFHGVYVLTVSDVRVENLEAWYSRLVDRRGVTS